MILPNRLSGDSKLVPWLNALRDYVLSITPLNGLNYRTKRTSNGTLYEIDPSTTGISLTRYHYKSMGSDHLICRTWNGDSEGGSDVYIAKPTKLRHSIVSESIDGVTITYANFSTSNQTRAASGSGTNETQVVVPRYLANDVLFVISAPTGVTVNTTVGGQPVTMVLNLLDLNVDGRAWAAV